MEIGVAPAEDNRERQCQAGSPSFPLYSTQRLNISSPQATLVFLRDPESLPVQPEWIVHQGSQGLSRPTDLTLPSQEDKSELKGGSYCYSFLCAGLFQEGCVLPLEILIYLL